MDAPLLLLVLTVAALAATAASKPSFAFRSNGKFKILVLADLHYGENAWEAWGLLQDVESTTLTNNLLDAEKPDLVVFLGDLITANNIGNKTATISWRQAIAPVEKRRIPWAAVFGNHDDAAFEWPKEWGPKPGKTFPLTSRSELMASEESKDLSASSRGPASLSPSVSNFHIQISSSLGGAAPAALLYFLDSGGGSYPMLISAQQASWFQNLANSVNPNQKIPELVFWHVPSKAYADIGPKPNAAISPPCVGSINFDSMQGQTQELGMMDILSKRSSAKAVIVGHQHGLDWCCPMNSLWLCFARHSGYGGYGSWTRGARVLELSENAGAAPTVKTWIRLEDGTVLASLNL